MSMLKILSFQSFAALYIRILALNSTMIKNKARKFPSRLAIGHTSQKSTAQAIQMEYQNASLQEERRRKAFMSILANDPMDIEKYFKCIIYGLGSLITSMLPTLLFTLIPAHNIFTEYEY